MKQRLPIPGLVLARIAARNDVERVVAAMSRRPDVLYAEPNWIYRATATPNDPRFGELWGLHQASDVDIDAPEAWDITTGSSNVTVAVVDTGVAYDHPDLAPNVWANPGETGGGKETNGVDDDGNGFIDDHRGWDFFSNDKDPRDQAGHGTHVAGTIGAKGNDGVGVVGVNWNVKLMPVRVLGPQGGTNAMVTAGFAYAGANGAKVANASLGGGGFSQAMKDAIDGASNTLFVVAAGNDNSNNDSGSTPEFPCNYTSANLICVAATTETDARASFSNYGATSVDLGAPGTNIVSTWPAYSSIFTDNFDTTFANWITGGTNNTWNRTTERSVSPSFSAADSPGANYVDFTDSWMRTAAAVNLSGRQGCQVQYAMRLAAEFGFDFLDVMASSDGVNFTFQDSWTGFTSGGNFFTFETDLSPYDGMSSVFVRFALFADETITADGAHIDDVDIRCVDTTYDANDYNSISGTSMATPHVAGVAGLLWAVSPTATVANVRSWLLTSGDSIPSMSGVTVTGRRLNARNAVLLAVPTCLGSPATMIGTAAGETLTGTSGNDVIVGLGGDDTLIGAGGNDKMCGGEGSDTGDFASAPGAVNASLAGGTATGDGSDTLATLEKLTGSGFNDTLTGDNGPNTLDGGGGLDTLTGLAGNDSLLGGLGNDVLRGGLDNDTVNGGDGTADVVDFQTAPNAITIDLGAGTSTGTGSDTLSNVENVFGSGFDDTITGSDVRNVLHGFAGTDTISAAGGNDELLGGFGVDTLNGGEGGDVMSGNQDGDHLFGGNGDDQLRGGIGDDDLHGEGGLADTVDVSTAASATVNLTTGVSTGLGSDTLEGLENIVASQGADTLTGSDVSNFVIALDGADTINLMGGNDVVRAGFGNDTVDGGDGTDLLDFSTSPFVMTVDLVLGTATGAGSDTISNIENVWGGGQGDTITGSIGPNIIVGLGGNDNLNGLAGDDALHGNDGDDNLDGGDDTDLCRQNAGTGTVVNCET